MRKLRFFLVVFAVSVVAIFVLMPILAEGGFTKNELTLVGILLLCNTISVFYLLRYLRVQIKEGEREIKRIERKISENEAEQGRLLREMNSLRPHLMRPEIKKKLPRAYR